MAGSQLSPLHPIYAALYGSTARSQINDLAVTDLDSAQNIWGGSERGIAFRNVLVGPVSQRSDIWQGWLSGGVVEYSDYPAFYVVKQSFVAGGKTHQRWAIVAGLAIDDSSIIIHEDVVAEGVERARQATEACEGDLAPIFVGYDEVLAGKVRTSLQRLVEKQEPLLTFRDPKDSGNTHTLWELCEAKDIRDIQDLLRGEKLYLLDGHHRLAAAKSNWRQAMGDGKILAYVCSFAAEDTMILPIHRAVHNSTWMLTDRLVDDWIRLGCQIRELTNVDPKNIEQQATQLLNNDLSCLVLHAHSNKLLELRFPGQLEAIPLEERDMAVAHLEYYLQKHFQEATVIPVTDPKFALEQLALEQAQVAFFMPPLRPFQVKRVAGAGLKLPRKSTRFVPKPALGLVMRPWR